MHVPEGKVMVALTVRRCAPVLDPLSNSLPLDYFPRGQCVSGPVLEGDEIYQGYNDRFALQFPAQ